MSNVFSWVTRCIVSALLLLPIFSTAGQAQGPLPPQNVKATVIYEQTDDYKCRPAVLLQWTAYPAGSQILGFYIWQSPATDPNTPGFEKIAKVPYNSATKSYEYVVRTLTSTDSYYRFYITSYDNMIGSMSSDTVWANAYGDNNGIQFITKPELTATVGQPYVYKAMSSNMFGAPIATTYTLVSGPQDMKVDPTTGTVEWTPTQEGDVFVSIRAQLVMNSIRAIHQCWTIHVSPNGPVPCAKLYGTIADESGATINEGTVTAYRISNGATPLFRSPIVNGWYGVAVDAGTYLLYVEGPSFESQWFNGATDPVTATPVKIECGQGIESNFRVHSIQSAFGTVTGKVYDATALKPTPVMGTIEFETVGSADGSRSWKPEVFATKTDVDGSYKISLPAGFKYIAHVTPLEPNYLDQYYNRVYDRNLATPIAVDGKDILGIDFPVGKRVSGTSGFSGTVMSDLRIGIPSYVIAFRLKPGDPATGSKDSSIVFSRSVETDVDGNYSFSDLEHGTYLALAIPKGKGWFPGYYRQNDIAAMDWSSATRINVADAMPAVMLDIMLRRMQSTIGGVAKLHGMVTAAGSGSGSVVAGALVYLLDQNNTPITYAVSDGNGEYMFTELSAGTYTVVGDKAGYVEYRATVTTDNENKSDVLQNIPLRSSGTSSVHNGNELPSSTVSASPNPAGNILTVSFASVGTPVHVSLVNAIGAELRRQTVTARNSIGLDVSDIPAGAYFVRVQTGSGTSVIPVTIVR